MVATGAHPSHHRWQPGNHDHSQRTAAIYHQPLPTDATPAVNSVTDHQRNCRRDDPMQVRFSGSMHLAIRKARFYICCRV